MPPAPARRLGASPLTPSRLPSRSAVAPTVGRLPFNVIDEVIHILDTEAAPWTVQLEVRVRGSFDEGRLRAALATALSLHPLARARKRPARAVERAYEWEVPEEPDLDPLRVVECYDDEGLAAVRARLQSLPVPLVESPPLRVRLVRHPGGDLLMLNVHHAASDGFGCLRILRSLARAYAGEPDPVPQIDLLGVRDLRPHLGARDARTRLRRGLLLLEKLRDLGAVPARLAHDGGSDRPGYGFHHVRLPDALGRRLVHGERGRATVNDLLLAALHLAIGRWNDEHGVRTRRIGVLVPVNLRPREWREELVRNVSLPVRISTGVRDRGTAGAAVAAVMRGSRRIKEQGTAGALVEVLGGPASLPGWAKEALPALLWLTGDRLVDTAMLSNLGAIEAPSFGPDPGPVTELWFSPPARMPLGLAVGAVTVAGGLHVALRHRHRLFDAGAAARFAARYLAALEDVAAAVGEPQRPGWDEARRHTR